MAKQFLLAMTKEQFTMVSCWRDELYCSVLKDGTISLRARTEGDDGSYWHNSIRGIKTPKDFVEAFKGIDTIETEWWSIEDDFLPVLYEEQPSFAKELEQYLKLLETGVEA